MFWIIIIAVFCYFIYKGYHENSNNSYEIHTVDSEPVSSVGFSKDIYKAIEEFARLCCTCKQETRWEYDYRDHAQITVTQSSKGTKLELCCRGDCIALKLPQKYRWLLNEDDVNEIKYVDDSVTGYVQENYSSTVPTEADSLFYFYKKGDPHAIGKSMYQQENGNVVVIYIELH